MQLSLNLPRSIAVLIILFISVSPVNALAFTISGGDTCIPVGSSTDLSIALSDIPDGLSGLNISIAINNPEMVTITNATLHDWAELHSTSSLPADQVWLKMVDLQQKVNPGDMNVSVGRISVLARKGGKSVISVTAIKIEDDIGGRYMMVPAQKMLCTGNSTVSNSGTPTQTLNNIIITPAGTPSPANTSLSQIPETQQSASHLPTQTIGSKVAPASTDTVSQSNITLVTTIQTPPSAPASPSLMLPLISCIVCIALIGLHKKN
jgi:hypothetical protein